MSLNTIDADAVSPGRAVGSSVRRREDGPLLTGEGQYTDDLTYPGEVQLAILRSRFGHARIVDIDTSAAEALDGVMAVYTRDDLLEAGLDGTIPGDTPEHGVDIDRPMLAGEKVRYQGDPIAGVVATDRYTAHDAVDRIDVTYERLDAVTDISTALADDAPTIHEEAPNNVAFEWESGNREETMATFDEASDVVEVDLSINKVVAVPMEPRAAVAQYRPAAGHLTVELGCQNVLGVQNHLSSVLGIPEHRITVRAPEVGGGFGVKAQPYTGHILAAWCAMQLERPVKWQATRSEAFATTNHSRRHDLTARAALKDGRIIGLHVDSNADVGGYLTSGGAGVPTGAFGTRLLGQYDIDNALVEVTGVFTNTNTLSAYRGAGRPEAAYVIERLVNACARELGEDPLEFRRRNFIQPDQFPYETPFGSGYDSGDYEKTLDKALEYIDYEGFREEQAAARDEGRYLGIGFSNYIEICGGWSGALQGGQLKMHPSGKVVARCSFVDNGQGHETGFAQIIADELGLELDDIEVVTGDSDRVPEGGGTGGSQTMTMGGNALKAGAQKLKDRARAIAAHELEAAPDDIVFDDGTFHIAGVPSRGMTIQEIAEKAYSGELPEDARGLEETAFFSPDGSTAPFGTHAVIVEIDPDSGELSIDRYVAIDDVGTQINPKLIEGQIVGGIVQSIGQAIYENTIYDENGNLLSGTLQDYAVPRATHVPEIEWDSTVTPSPNNPLGVKGVGEAGTIATMPAIVNAAIDALEPFGVEHLDMPLTQERIWRAVHDDT